MAIAIKNITNCHISACSNTNAYRSNCTIDFEAGEFRYHIWVRPQHDGTTWELGLTLYRNLINFGERYKKTKNMDVLVNANAINHVMAALNLGTISGINHDAINAFVDAHNTSEIERRARELAEANTARAAKIRATLMTAIFSGVYSPQFAHAVGNMIEHGTDDDLNSLDHLFNVVI